MSDDFESFPSPSRSFVKLYSTILTSSIWLEDHLTFRLWITMLVSSDARGFVDASLPGLANVARLSREQCKGSLAKLEAPDEYSKSSAHEGRRIKKVERGWIILNYAHYRDQFSRGGGSYGSGYVYYMGGGGKTIKIGFSKNPWARLSDLRVAQPDVTLLATEPGSLELERQRHEQFAADRTKGEWFTFSDTLRAHIASLASGATVATPTTPVATKKQKEKEKQKTPTATSAAPAAKTHDDEAFEAVWAVYPKRGGTNPRGRARKAWNARRKEGVSATAMFDGVLRYEKYVKATGKIGTEFALQAATFFGPDKHYEQSHDLPVGPSRAAGSGDNGTGKVALMLSRLKLALVQHRPPQGRVVHTLPAAFSWTEGGSPIDDRGWAELRAAVAAIGGPNAIAGATPEKWSYLVRDFTAALTAAHRGTDASR